MKQYETMVIVDAMISDDAINQELEKIQQTIKDSEGEILRVDNWGKRKMAYSISKKSHGNYAVVYYTANEKAPLTLEKDFRINENILRWITLKDQPMTEAYTEEEVVAETPVAKEVKTEEKKEEVVVESKEVAED